MNNTIICSLPDLMRYSFLQEFSKNISLLSVYLTSLCSWLLSWKYAHLGGTSTKKPINTSPSKALFCSLALSDLCDGLVVVPLHFGLMLATIVEVPSLYCALVSPTTVLAFVMVSVSLMTTTAIARCGQISRFLP